jgi:hypothetical protein
MVSHHNKVRKIASRKLVTMLVDGTVESVDNRTTMTVLPDEREAFRGNGANQIDLILLLEDLWLEVRWEILDMITWRTEEVRKQRGGQETERRSGNRERQSAEKREQERETERETEEQMATFEGMKNRNVIIFLSEIACGQKGDIRLIRAINTNKKSMSRFDI